MNENNKHIMGRKFLLLAIFVTTFITSFAQEGGKPETSFNKWSIDGGVGLTKLLNYDNGRMDFVATEIGVRYMPDNLFGVKANFGFSRYSDGKDIDYDFTTNQYRLEIQGVINLGRVLRFESWTRTFNILAYAGGGVGIMDYGLAPDADQWVGIITTGLTGQFKLSPRMALNVGCNLLTNTSQEMSFSGNRKSNTNEYGLALNTTVGLSVYLGRHNTHADWHVRPVEKRSDLLARISALESRLDGYAQEGDLAATRGDVDDLKRQVAYLNNNKETTSPETYDDFIKRLLNDGYVNIYFDVNRADISRDARTVLGFVNTYLSGNPGVNLDVLGYADETGSNGHNQKLSQRRAEAALKVLSDAGIDVSRLSASGKGVDSNIRQSSEQGRSLARRVSFMVK